MNDVMNSLRVFNVESVNSISALDHSSNVHLQFISIVTLECANYVSQYFLKKNPFY